MDTVRDRYQLCRSKYLILDPTTLEPFVRENGVNAFYSSLDKRLHCCDIRKVDPLARALTTVDAWVSGQRRGHSETRRGVRKIAPDATHDGKLKLNPLADWTEEQVWSYVRANNIPHNALYDMGFTSIGCAPCTRRTQAGEDASRRSLVVGRKPTQGVRHSLSV